MRKGGADEASNKRRKQGGNKLQTMELALELEAELEVELEELLCGKRHSQRHNRTLSLAAFSHCADMPLLVHTARVYLQRKPPGFALMQRRFIYRAEVGLKEARLYEMVVLVSSKSW